MAVSLIGCLFELNLNLIFILVLVLVLQLFGWWVGQLFEWGCGKEVIKNHPGGDAWIFMFTHIHVGLKFCTAQIIILHAHI